MWPAISRSRGRQEHDLLQHCRATEQGRWPRGPRASIGANIFICSEDGIADTIRPRLEAAGADLSLVHVLDSTIKREGKLRGFTLQNDLDLLGEAIDKIGNVDHELYGQDRQPSHD
jgi:hypothetical protein